MTVPRVAFFADSFYEVNGVALTCRQFDAYARRQNMPFFSAHIGPETKLLNENAVSTLELARGPAAFPIERDMSFDPFLVRHRKQVERALRGFSPDVIHITGPSDIGILGAYLARKLRIPLLASWHTNLHEFAALRLNKVVPFLPVPVRQWLSAFTQRQVFKLCSNFYHLASVLMAPNPELVQLLTASTGRPVFLMERGADSHLFSPLKRTRFESAFVLGFVGRITPEKGVRLLVDIERQLRAAGLTNYRFMIVGHGSETDWLKHNLRSADFPGVLKGEDLARAYAAMDAFVFPSRTDTFGNVVVEAIASGVPALVTDEGGPKFIIDQGKSGFVCRDSQEFANAILQLESSPALRFKMSVEARQRALAMSWDAVFQKVYGAYRVCLHEEALRPADLRFV